MKITAIRTDAVNLPADEPLANAPENPNGKRPIVTLVIETDAGITGLGVAYFGGALTRTLRHAIDELGALLVGDDPVLVEAAHAEIQERRGRLCRAGRHLSPRAVGDRHRAVGHPRQIARAAAVETARRCARAGADLCLAAR